MKAINQSFICRNVVFFSREKDSFNGKLIFKLSTTIARKNNGKDSDYKEIVGEMTRIAQKDLNLFK